MQVMDLGSLMQAEHFLPRALFIKELLIARDALVAYPTVIESLNHKIGEVSAVLAGKVEAGLRQDVVALKQKKQKELDSIRKALDRIGG